MEVVAGQRILAQRRKLPHSSLYEITITCLKSVRTPPVLRVLTVRRGDSMAGTWSLFINKMKMVILVLPSPPVTNCTKG